MNLKDEGSKTSTLTFSPKKEKKKLQLGMWDGRLFMMDDKVVPVISPHENQ